MSAALNADGLPSMLSLMDSLLRYGLRVRRSHIRGAEQHAEYSGIFRLAVRAANLSYEDLLFLKFRDCLDARRLGSGKSDPIASVPVVQRQAVLQFELFRSAPAIRSDGTALRLLNRNGAIGPVYFGNCSTQRLLGKSRRADDGEDSSASQNGRCDFHGSLRALDLSAINRGGRIGSHRETQQGWYTVW
jgi:hypothetical protein